MSQSPRAGGPVPSYLLARDPLRKKWSRFHTKKSSRGKILPLNEKRQRGGGGRNEALQVGQLDGPLPPGMIWGSYSEPQFPQK